MTELWRAAFGSYQAMVDRGVDIVVAEARLQFRQPARFDEEIDLSISVVRAGNTSIVSEHRIERAGVLLVEGLLRHVIVDRQTLTKASIPDWLRAGLAPWTTGASP
jgi:acyl-CoA thioester hydrolase